MAGENSIAEEKPNSLLEVDPMFYEKIQARNSFVGQSMRLFHSENEASVPFGWEQQPGTPKHSQTEVVPPLKPPPWLQSQSLGKPNFDSLTSTTLMSCFWKKKSRKNYKQANPKPNNGRQGHLHGNGNNINSHANSEKFLELSDVKDVETTSSSSSADHSRSSSSSSSISNSPSNTTNSSSSSSSRSRSFAKGLIKWSF